MSYEQKNFSDFEQMFKARLDGNRLLVAMGQPPKLFTQEEILKHLEITNARLQDPYNRLTQNEQAYLNAAGEFDHILFKDPTLQFFLNQNVDFIEKFVEVETNYSLKDKWINSWNKIINGLSVRYSDMHQRLEKKERLEAYELYEKEKAQDPRFASSIYLLHNTNVFQPLSYTLSNVDNIILKLDINPLPVSIKNVCSLIHLSIGQESNLSVNRFLDFETAKKLDDLGFNFDWLMAFSNSLGPHRLMKSMVFKAMCAMASTVEEKPVLPNAAQYMRFILERSSFFQNEENFNHLIDKIEKKYFDNTYQLNFLKPAIENTKSIYQSLKEKKLLGENMAVSSKLNVCAPHKI